MRLGELGSFGGVAIALLTIVAIPAAIVAIAVARGRQFAALARDGIPATATVTRRFTASRGGRSPGTKRIGFSYVGPDGQNYERFASIGSGHFSELSEGDPLPIVLLPDKPGTSAPAWLVEDARRALAKRKSK